MGKLRKRTIEVVRTFIDPSAGPAPDFDYDEIYPITTFSAVRSELHEPNSTTLDNELNRIRALINDRYIISKNHKSGFLMTFGGKLGEITATQIKGALSVDDNSDTTVLSETAIANALEKKVNTSVLNAHVKDKNIHLSLEQQEALCNVVDTASFNSHIDNTSVHISDEDRNNWNNKADQLDLEQHINDSNNPHKIKPEDIGTYSSGEIDTFFASIPASFFNYMNIQTDGRLTGKLVPYNSNNENPTYVVNDSELGDFKVSTITQYVLKPDPLDNTRCIIYLIEPSTAKMNEIGSRVMKDGDMVMTTAHDIYLWQNGEWKYLELQAPLTGGSEPPKGDSDGSYYYWYPNVSNNGVLTWTLREGDSKHNLPPSAVNIRGAQGEPGRDGLDGEPGIGIPPGGSPGNILIKGGNDASAKYNYVAIWADLMSMINEYFKNPDNVSQLTNVLRWENITGRPNITNSLNSGTDPANTVLNITGIKYVIQDIQDMINGLNIDTGHIDRVEDALEEHMRDTNNPHMTRFADLKEIPDRFAPSIHASTHHMNGSDPIAPHDIGAASLDDLNDHTSATNNPHNVTIAQLDSAGSVTNLIKNILDASDMHYDIYSDDGIINTLDDLVELMNKTIASGFVKDVRYNSSALKLSVTVAQGDGSTNVFDYTLPFANILKGITYDEITKRLSIILPNGENVIIDAPKYDFDNSGNNDITFSEVYSDSGSKGTKVVRVEGNISDKTIKTKHLADDIQLPLSATAVTKTPYHESSDAIATTKFIRNAIYGDNTPDTLYPKDPTKDENVFATYSYANDGRRILSASIGKWLYDTKLNAREVMQLINDNLLKVISDIDLLKTATGEELSDTALSAAIGKYLYENKANLNHAYPNDVSGRATEELFGHAKVFMHIPRMDSEKGHPGTDDGRFAPGDHQHPSDTSRAPIEFSHLDVMRGIVQAETPPESSNDLRVANTEWVMNKIITGAVEEFHYTMRDKVLSAETILTFIGRPTDEPHPDGTVYARMAYVVELINAFDGFFDTFDERLTAAEGNIEANKKAIGNKTDEADDNGSVHARINSLKEIISAIDTSLTDLTRRVTTNEISIGNLEIYVGEPTDDPDRDGSLYARIKAVNSDLNERMDGIQLFLNETREIASANKEAIGDPKDTPNAFGSLYARISSVKAVADAAATQEDLDALSDQVKEDLDDLSQAIKDEITPKINAVQTELNNVSTRIQNELGDTASDPDGTGTIYERLGEIRELATESQFEIISDADIKDIVNTAFLKAVPDGTLVS